MSKQDTQLLRIDGDHVITAETDPEFLRVLQRGLLLALQERGTIRDTQIMQAEDGGV